MTRIPIPSARQLMHSPPRRSQYKADCVRAVYMEALHGVTDPEEVARRLMMVSNLFDLDPWTFKGSMDPLQPLDEKTLRLSRRHPKDSVIAQLRRA